VICDSITKTLATPCSASWLTVYAYALCTFATRHFFTRLRQITIVLFVWAKFVFAPTFEVPPFFFPTIFLLLSTVLCISASSSSFKSQFPYLILVPLRDIDVKLAWEIQQGSQEFGMLCSLGYL
ncbi:hypothetical protein EDD22DRAFT_936758, partial [Suillus occidentalis]